MLGLGLELKNSGFYLGLAAALALRVKSLLWPWLML